MDELRQELEKWSLSKAGLKAEKGRLKKAMLDKITVVDTAKFSAGPNNFDKVSRWKILEPTNDAEEPECEDSSMVDPTESKYSNGKKEISRIKVKKMNYDTKFERATFSVECLQPKK